MTISSSNTPEAQRELGLLAPEPTRPRLSHAAKLLTGFWRSGEWPVAWALLIALIAFQVGAVYLSVTFVEWEKDFFDALEVRNTGAFAGLFVVLAVLMVIGIIKPLIGTFINKVLNLRWRIWMTEHYMERWIRHKAYHEIERTRLIDNPDQRISEDVRMLTEGVMNTFIAFTSSIMTGLAFSVVLWKTSSPIILGPVSIPGDIVWYGWAYAIFGSILIIYIGRPMVQRTMRQQHVEADFRFRLINIRRNAEQIALFKAGPFELNKLREAFGHVRRNFMYLIYAEMRLQAGQTVYGQFTPFLPLILMLPKYLAGAITLGALMQIRESFLRLHSSLSIFVQAYGGVATLIAVMNRLKLLDDAINNPPVYYIDVETNGHEAIEVRNLQLSLPDGAHLLAVGDWTIAKGERWSIRGASGAGKSTLLRALAGLWPDGGGSVVLPAKGRIMFVPQRLYLPHGLFKDSLCFPGEASDFSDERVVDVLTRCRLPNLIDRLDISDSWQDILSPGEQQRVALARVLLHRPDYLIMDEATSALDPDNATYLYQTLIDELPGVTLVSVTHSDALTHCHTHMFAIADKRGLPAPIRE